MKKKMKGFEGKKVLVVSLHDMDREFQDLFYKRSEEGHNRGYNRFWSELDPDDKEDYNDTFTMANIEQYWKDQTNNNNYKGTLEEFIEEYGLKVEVWFINCGYDFTGVKEIIIDC
jgi:hypothetical protein